MRIGQFFKLLKMRNAGGAKVGYIDQTKMGLPISSQILGAQDAVAGAVVME
jgi:hypothetical protein